MLCVCNIMIYNLSLGYNCARSHWECGLKYCGKTGREILQEWESECVFIGITCTPQHCECKEIHYRLKEGKIDDRMEEENKDIDDVEV